MPEEKQTASVCAVLVTYQAEQASLEKRLQALASAVRHLVVVDNGSPALDKALLAVSYPALVFKTLPDNQGIAAAQNEGIRLAARAGASHVLLLDQDSDPQADMIARLVSAWQQLEARGRRPACVGPQLRLRGSSALSFFPRPGWGGLRSVRCSQGAGLVECDYVIASGTLIPLDVFSQVGDLEEPLFIDHVDTEWCYRARARGYRVFGVCGAVLEHELGAGYRQIWLGRSRRIARHAAFRYYYIFRNVLMLSGRSYVPLGWRARQRAWLCVLFVAFGLGSGVRSKELRMMLKGIRHAMGGIRGKLRPQGQA